MAVSVYGTCNSKVFDEALVEARGSPDRPFWAWTDIGSSGLFAT